MPQLSHTADLPQLLRGFGVVLGTFGTLPLARWLGSNHLALEWAGIILVMLGSIGGLALGEWLGRSFDRQFNPRRVPRLRA